MICKRSHTDGNMSAFLILKKIPGNSSGSGMIFQQGGQDQPFPAGGLGRCKAPAGGKQILRTIF